jgi:hypothetical protein
LLEAASRKVTWAGAVSRLCDIADTGEGGGLKPNHTYGKMYITKVCVMRVYDPS